MYTCRLFHAIKIEYANNIWLTCYNDQMSTSRRLIRLFQLQVMHAIFLNKSIFMELKKKKNVPLILYILCKIVNQLLVGYASFTSHNVYKYMFISISDVLHNNIKETKQLLLSSDNFLWLHTTNVYIYTHLLAESLLVHIVVELGEWSLRDIYIQYQEKSVLGYL